MFNWPSIDWTTITPWAVLLVGELLLAWAGWLILRWGIRHGRRVGDEPRCRTCEYELTGITSNNCPECGSDLDEKTVVFGLRRRGWVRIGFGGVLLLGVLAGVGLTVHKSRSRVNWYQYYTTGMIERAIHDDHPELIKIVTTNLKPGLLTPAELNRVIEALLERHGRDMSAQPPRDVSLLLVFSNIRDRMDEEQRLRCRRQFQEIILEPFHQARQGEWLNVRISTRYRGFPTLAAGEVMIVSLESDDGMPLIQPLDAWKGEKPRPLLDAAGVDRWHYACWAAADLPRPSMLRIPLPVDITPGRRVFAGELQWKADYYSSGPRPIATDRFSFTVEVLAGDAPRERGWADTSVTQHEIAKVLAQYVSLQEHDGGYEVSCASRWPEVLLFCDLAFEVSAFDGDRSFSVGYLTYNSRTQEAVAAFGPYIPGDVDPEQLEFSFVSSLDVVQRVGGVGPIWNGEVMLGPLQRHVESGVSHWVLPFP